MRTEKDYEKEFQTRTLKHILLVNKYANKMGKRYPDHDGDKLNELFKDYSLMKKKNHLGGTNLGDDSDGLTEEEQERLNRATENHISHNQHHPEYWAEESIEGFDRFDPPMGLHCESMTEEAMDEMCCDWCAMSEEFNNTPQEWAKKTIPSRWVFTEEQEEYIYNKLDELWGGKE